MDTIADEQCGVEGCCNLHRIKSWSIDEFATFGNERARSIGKAGSKESIQSGPGRILDVSATLDASRLSPRRFRKYLSLCLYCSRRPECERRKVRYGRASVSGSRARL